MMTQCIKKEDAVEAVWRILNGMVYSQNHNDRLVEEVDAVLDEYTAADVRPVVRGKWQFHMFTARSWGYECRVCHTTWDTPTNYCPNCGADMRPTSMSGANGEEI